eukprot:3704540-Pyramimonas_sp.AAC.1
MSHAEQAAAIKQLVGRGRRAGSALALVAAPIRRVPPWQGLVSLCSHDFLSGRRMHSYREWKAAAVVAKKCY